MLTRFAPWKCRVVLPILLWAVSYIKKTPGSWFILVCQEDLLSWIRMCQTSIRASQVRGVRKCWGNISIAKFEVRNMVLATVLNDKRWKTDLLSYMKIKSWRFVYLSSSLPIGEQLNNLLSIREELGDPCREVFPWAAETAWSFRGKKGL
jgi:hypothetical protein